MSSKKKIGKLIESKTVEWTIENFSSYTQPRLDLISPDFCLFDHLFHLQIYPRGKSKESLDCVSLYLNKNNLKFKKVIQFTFGIKSVDGEIVEKREATWHSDDFLGWGFQKFIARSVLLGKKEVLVPLDALTVTCSVYTGENALNVYARVNNLKADIKNMFITKKNTDVTIKVKEENFSAHRCILAARSPVLAAMFENEMTEKKTGFIDISDCDPVAFRHFLLYLYSGEVDDSEKCDFFLLYKIADKYDVPEVKQVCIDSMVDCLSFENFCEIYAFAHQFNEKQLLTSVQNFFKDNFEKIVSSGVLLSLMKEDCDLANNLFKTIASKVKIQT